MIQCAQDAEPASSARALISKVGVVDLLAGPSLPEGAAVDRNWFEAMLHGCDRLPLDSQTTRRVSVRQGERPRAGFDNAIRVSRRVLSNMVWGVSGTCPWK